MAGVKVDYLSIILYLTDILWVIFTIFNLQTSIFKRKKNESIWRYVVVLLVVAGNIAVAAAKWVAVYRWLRVGQWLITVWLVSINKKKIEDILKITVPVWILMECFLAVAQVAKGGSLQGIWWWLGERRFSFGTIGIAQMRWGDEAAIRGYGTFSHPNSLAGFLLLAWTYWKQKSSTIRLQSSMKVKIWYWIVNWAAILGIILTGSRTVWAITILIWILETRNQRLEWKEIFGKIMIGAGLVIIVLGAVGREYDLKSFVGGWDSLSWQKRMSLNGSAWRMIQDSPFVGVGAGNFTKRLPEYQKGAFYWLQPVHNILLLSLSEVGIAGVVAGFWLLKDKFRKIGLVMGLIILVTGMVDHYWLTLPQNTWLLAVILGVLG